jgi:hypothetical protein
MRLINIWTLEQKEFSARGIPKYFILSHRWGRKEVSYKDYSKKRNLDGPGYEKILGACKFARLFAFEEGGRYPFRHGKRKNQKVPPFHEQWDTYENAAEFLGVKNTWEIQGGGVSWIWIDSCCIDKRSTAELSEAINSMYVWYQRAQLCFAYLADVLEHDSAKQSEKGPFEKSSWFSRGWTLQELLAPEYVIFCDASWDMIGHMCKRCAYRDSSGCPDGDPEGFGHNLLTEVSQITAIPETALADFERPERIRFIPGNEDARLRPSVAQIMSWASKRETTLPEDEAYCLLGLLDVQMPLLYGEGRYAFRRLQEEIIKNSRDQSIFAWREPPWSEAPDELGTGRFPGVLAESPEYFSDCGCILFDPAFATNDGLYAITNSGVQLDASLYGTEAYTRGLEIQLSYEQREAKMLSRLYIWTLNCKRSEPENISKHMTLFHKSAAAYRALPAVRIALVRANNPGGCSLYMRALTCDLGEHLGELSLKSTMGERKYLVTWQRDQPAYKLYIADEPDDERDSVEDTQLRHHNKMSYRGS